MVSPLYFISADPFIGKIDKHSLSQQTLMELFAEGITNRHRLFRSSESPKDISEWKGVHFNTSDDIIKVTWNVKGLTGSINLQWLPLSMKHADLSWNQLYGSLDLTCLPDSLEVLVLAINTFQGTVDLTQLPPGIHTLNLCGNGKLVGETDFSQLPQSLTSLNVASTHLEGTIGDFDGLLDVRYSKVKDMRKKE